MVSLSDRETPASAARAPDRRARRLMGTVGIVLMATPTAELAVQLHYGERPHVVLLGGLFLVGLLVVSNALSKRPVPERGRSGTGAVLRAAPSHGPAVWPPDRTA